MTDQILAGINAEISRREAELEDWREFGRLAGKLLGAGEAAPAAPLPELPPAAADRPSRPAPRRAPSTSSGARRPRENAAERRREILSLLSTRGPLSPAALREALGVDRNELQGPLRRLIEEGAIVGQGATANRTYDVARNGDKPGQPDPPASGTNGHTPALSPRVAKLEAQASTDGAEMPELEDRVLDVLRAVGGRVALSEIEFQLRRRHGDCDRGELEHAARRLTTHGLVARDGGGGLRLADVDPECPLESVIADVAGVDAL